MRAGVVAVPCLVLGLSCAPRSSAGGPQQPSRATSEACTAGAKAPSREGFFHEVLFAAPTPRTPRFDAYTPGSYGVNKRDLVQGLPQQADRCGVHLRAVLVVGPMGGLWTYHVAALVDEGANVRINTVVMPHARIAAKRTGVISVAEGASMVQSIREAFLVHEGVPATADSLAGDFSYRLLLATYDRGRPEYFHSSFHNPAPDRALDVLLERVNRFLDRADTPTYAHGDTKR